jgi:hypothetical protein
MYLVFVVSGYQIRYCVTIRSVAIATVDVARTIMIALGFTNTTRAKKETHKHKSAIYLPVKQWSMTDKKKEDIIAVANRNFSYCEFASHEKLTTSHKARFKMRIVSN